MLDAKYLFAMLLILGGTQCITKVIEGLALRMGRFSMRDLLLAVVFVSVGTLMLVEAYNLVWKNS